MSKVTFVRVPELTYDDFHPSDEVIEAALMRQERVEAANRRIFEKLDAATRIQVWVLKKLSQHRHQIGLYNNAATLIQKIFRGWRVRRTSCLRAINLNTIDGWLIIPPPLGDYDEDEACGLIRFHVLKKGSVEFTPEELDRPVCISCEPGERPTRIVGQLRFEDETEWIEPRGGWTLSKFKKLIGKHEFWRRSHPKNYFLGRLDRQRVLWAGCEIVNGVCKPTWDS